jgi:hypothetical protein
MWTEMAAPIPVLAHRHLPHTTLLHLCHLLVGHLCPGKLWMLYVENDKASICFGP